LLGVASPEPGGIGGRDRVILCHPLMRSLWRPWLLLAFSTLVLGLYTARNPPPTPIGIDWRLFGWPAAEKLLTALRAFGCWTAINVAAWGLAGPFRRLMEREGEDSLIRLVERLGLGLLVLSTLVLGLAALHLLHGGVLLGVLAVGVALWAIQARRAASRLSWRWPGRGSLVVAGFALLLLNPLLECFVPFHGWDALTYHLAVPERYLHANGIFLTPFSFYTALPLSTEMLYLLALGLDSETAARLMHFEFGALCLLTTYALGRRVSRRAALLAPLLLLADPLFSWELTVAYSDLTLAFYALLAVSCLDDWRSAHRSVSLVSCGVFAGAAMAARYQGGFVVAAAVLLALLAPGPHRAIEKVRGAVLIAATSLLVASPWLLRNLVLTGNPVAPMLQGVFYQSGHEYFDPVVIAQQVAYARLPGLGRGIVEFLSAPWNITLRNTANLYVGSFGFQIGPLYLIGLGACVVLGRKLVDPGARLALQAAFLLAAAWFWTGQEARFLLPALALVALAGAVAFDALLEVSRPLRTALLTAAVYALVLCQWPLWNVAPQRYAYALGGLSKESLEDRDPVSAVGRHLRRALGPNDRLLLWREPRGYYFRGLDYIPDHNNAGSPVIMLFHRAADPHSLHCSLAAMGVSHVLFNWNAAHPPLFVEGYGPDDWSRDRQRVDAFVRDWTRPELEYGGLLIGRLRPAAGCEPAPARQRLDAMVPAAQATTRASTP
jgi:hypothetical protein